MDSARAALYLGIFILALSVLCHGQGALDNRLSAHEEQQLITRDLAEALEDMLDGDEDNRIQLEKKASVIPRCDVGERCALKHGPRIGRLCDCMRGTVCNTFFLRCY
ncbi:cocaine- and amphetamine-regulated transcript protein-like [Astyanax mexicanus]|uniref:CART prepropeptide n=1 Tax=Astyanax mexicanus TaxID=7994 RepID=A0A8B9RD03_ASTMX|nr:cocaine- and amphetamine-regulated transcript protein-like [Astyanax mexicanus]